MIVLASWLAYKKPGLRCYIVAALQMGTALSALLLWLLPLNNVGGLLFAAAILPSTFAQVCIPSCSMLSGSRISPSDPPETNTSAQVAYRELL